MSKACYCPFKTSSLEQIAGSPLLEPLFFYVIWFSFICFYELLLFRIQVTGDQFYVYIFIRNWKELDDYAVGFSNGNWSRWHSYNLVSQMLHRQSQHTLCLSVTDGESRLLKLKKYASTHWHTLAETHTHTYTHNFFCVCLSLLN